MITSICQICKKEFQVKPYRKELAKFCSFKCYGISKKGIHPKMEIKKGQHLSPQTEFKKETWLGKFGKDHPCFGKHWKQTEESNRKRSKAQKGIPRPWQKDELHHCWKGDDVGYFALHSWIKRNLGKPNKCEFCGKITDNLKYIHWANIDHSYKRNLTDWLRLCCSCHRQYDKNL